MTAHKLNTRSSSIAAPPSPPSAATAPTTSSTRHRTMKRNENQYQMKLLPKKAGCSAICSPSISARKQVINLVSPLPYESDRSPRGYSTPQTVHAQYREQHQHNDRERVIWVVNSALNYVASNERSPLPSSPPLPLAVASPTESETATSAATATSIIPPMPSRPKVVRLVSPSTTSSTISSSPSSKLLKRKGRYMRRGSMTESMLRAQFKQAKNELDEEEKTSSTQCMFRTMSL